MSLRLSICCPILEVDCFQWVRASKNLGPRSTAVRGSESTRREPHDSSKDDTVPAKLGNPITTRSAAQGPDDESRIDDIKGYFICQDGILSHLEAPVDQSIRFGSAQAGVMSLIMHL